MFNFFKKKKSIQSEILSDLKSAQNSIQVAVSWLTDVQLIIALIERKKAGVDVRVLVSSNELNIIRFELFKQLQDLGGYVQKWGNKEAKDGGFMHFKFYIIDNNLAKSGSYNWSINATTNAEALDKVDVSKKIEEFNAYNDISVNFFDDINDPGKMRDELEQIRKSGKQEILTPEALGAYRAMQKQKRKYAQEQREREERNERREAAIKEQQERLKNEQKKLEAQRLDAENKKRDEEKRIAAASQQAEERKEQQGRYQPKPGVEETKLPPTSFGNE